MPLSADQMGGAITERELGLDPPADLAELVEKVQQLPFESAFLLIARIAAAVWPATTGDLSGVHAAHAD